MDINRFAKEVHENAVLHGWWKKEPGLPELIALMHSELSEALREYRCGYELSYKYCENDEVKKLWGWGRMECIGERCRNWNDGKCPDADKPEGIAVELIDCILRILDYLGKEGVDVEALLLEKHEYNKTRPYMHGGKLC